ncbi:macrolide family glycosyltransferase [Clostridium felsineum]|uniref:Oleandomycin glycosyltransferase n=1 Tax=Clostridium felsineum TaxID=36839 RepID=A0A1S8KWZ5_9CLOT|nr:macrolide family glycosyltransferase [Clostridium felsineum]MCR3759555.1 glycosyl transferase [Clostridium felsineum]URZ05038.1 Oleandomycin glycosyltransferase [Clostridium felsineum]URZ10079.1 Oleandomycin glycosyltransferase [Clostridium felsineum]
MGKILFLSSPAYGHINPTLGIINELVKDGQEVTYFSTDNFKDSIENTGAIFKAFKKPVYTFKNDGGYAPNSAMGLKLRMEYFVQLLSSAEEYIDAILEQIKGFKFDAIGYTAIFPFGNIISQILKIPSFSSFAIFASPKEMISERAINSMNKMAEQSGMSELFIDISTKLEEKYNIKMPSIINLLFNEGNLNFAYTSEYFVAHPEYYNENFRFIGPPIYNRNDVKNDFPFEKLEGKRVIYVSLGTVFSNFDKTLYEIFFEAFKDMDAIVVMTAYKTDLSEFNIPKNFIVRNYISQSKVLKYAEAAVTHGGMNSVNDLIVNNVPFVAIPLGADQPYMSSRAEKLGACISLDRNNLTAEILKNSLNEILSNSKYTQNIRRINESFENCGGYKKAAEEILKLM